MLDAHRLGDDEDDFLWYFGLPEGKYELEIVGKTQENFHLCMAHRENPEEGILDYGSNPITSGGIASIMLDSSNSNAPLVLPDGREVVAKVIPIEEEEIRFDFDDGQAQNWTDDGSGCWSISEGTYVMTGTNTGKESYSHYNQEFTDFIYQVDTRKTGGDSDKSAYGYGLYVRSDGIQQNYYAFGIVVDGYYMIGKSVGGSFTKLVDWTTSNTIKTGYNQCNKLKIDFQGSTLKFYVNNTLLETIEDTTFSSGKVGLFVRDSASSSTPDTVQFDNVYLTTGMDIDVGGELGDVAPLGSRDGVVNVGDALVALRFALTLETPTQEDIAHGDVAPLDAQGKPDPDGVINVGDALVILRKALGIIEF
jgi:hypothetical protein